ncbi:hypothetical protein RIR_jg19791.t1 [Rhizophagus irregularis DAOM 181602=DAOM 197198]|nr:hypothetical protein RhiirB3_524563 [Rhizophagus irregularis]GET58902.1 hypothetical protein RIR_jg19791.t1 [Rhizophagus irregularis DAOM 181602=DAOM 197198]
MNQKSDVYAVDVCHSLHPVVILILFFHRIRKVRSTSKFIWTIRNHRKQKPTTRRMRYCIHIKVESRCSIKTE